MKITSLIDWQGAWVGPAYLQLIAPPAVASEFAGSDVKMKPREVWQESLTSEERVETERMLFEVSLHRTFEELTLPETVLKLPLRTLRMQMHHLVGYTWATGLLHLRFVNMCIRDGSSG